VTDDCHPDPSCTKTADNCLDDPGGPNGCLTVDHVYSCTATTSTTTTVNKCQNQMCLGDSCFTLTQDQNGDFQQVYSQLAAMQQAGADYATNPDFSVFKGAPLRCKKAVLGFANCCKDSGWGLSIGLARCDDGEKQLIAEQDKKATHYVGTYCSNKSLFGICLEKAMAYCGFGTSLPRIIQEAGRTQVGKGWGSPKTPDCSGFTVNQFQALDLTNVDFSDFYKDKLAGFTTPDAGGTVSSIQASIQSLYDNGTASAGPHE
jgi:conjugal transfer mating pair stabilization protein TraN